MAKLDGPLMSMGASGSIGGILTFGSNKGRNFVRQLVIPSNPKTASQTGVRSMLKWIGKEWSQLTPTEQATWAARAAQTNISNFNAFSSLGMDNWSNGKAPQSEDPAPTVVTPAGPPTAPADSVTEKRVTITWTDDVVGSDDFGVIVYISPTTGFTPARDNAVGVVDMTIQQFISQNMDPGTYYYRLGTFAKDGVISTTFSAEGSFVIA